MILRQFLHTEPVIAAYSVAYGGKSACVVVDPVDAPERDVRAVNLGQPPIDR